MSDMVEVVIDSIRVSLMSQQRIVILREQNAERYLPIWIGVYEAEFDHHCAARSGSCAAADTRFD